MLDYSQLQIIPIVCILVVLIYFVRRHRRYLQKHIIDTIFGGGFGAAALLFIYIVSGGWISIYTRVAWSEVLNCMNDLLAFVGLSLMSWDFVKLTGSKIRANAEQARSMMEKAEQAEWERTHPNRTYSEPESDGGCPHCGCTSTVSVWEGEYQDELIWDPGFPGDMRMGSKYVETQVDKCAKCRR